MITEWFEINERFDAIKDHKPKASKKLSELGEILSSAYLLDPNKADEMWQYIINLNVSDDVANAKFYIAQVFNKITDNLEPEEATTFLALNPERVRLMIFHGYEGGTQWHCLATLIRGFIAMHNIDNCVVIMNCFFDKFGGLYSGDESLFNVAETAIRATHEMVEEDDSFAEDEEMLLNAINGMDNEKIEAYSKIMLTKYGYENEDVEELLDLAIEYKLGKEFMFLLCENVFSLEPDFIANKWLSYLYQMDENERLPQLEYTEDTENYEESKSKVFVDIMKDNDEILQFYFKNDYDNITDYVIHDWIINGDWERLTRYMAQVVMNNTYERFEFSRFWRNFETYLDAYFYSEWHDSTDSFRRSYKVINESNIEEFQSALAKISAMSVGSPSQEDFHQIIKGFMEKASGSVDALNDVGFEEEVDERSSVQRLSDYITNFLNSGEKEHDSNTTEYRRLCDDIRDDIFNHDGSNTHTIKLDITGMVKKTLFNNLAANGTISEEDRDELLKDNEPDYQVKSDSDTSTNKWLEYYYSIANNEDFCKFYCLHCKRESNVKSEMLYACIVKDDFTRAIEIVDLMLQTEMYEDFEDDGWASEIKSVIRHITRKFDREKASILDVDAITDERVENVVQLIERIMPHLPDSEKDEVKVSLLHLAPNKTDNSEYIESLLADVEAYTTFPKPRGRGGAYNINRMSRNIMDSYEILARMNRLDILGQILSKFASVADVLAPVRFTTWISHLDMSLSGKDIYSLFVKNKNVFEEWLKFDLDDYDITRIAKKIGEECSRAEFLEFRNLVISRIGSVEGLDSCFEFTSENTETQVLLEGKHIDVKLDFVNVHGTSYMEINLLSIGKTEEVDSVRIVKSSVNGVETNEGKFWGDDYEDGGPEQGYTVYTSEQKDTLTYYTDFFDDNHIKEVNSIVLTLAGYNEDGGLVETFTDAIIKLDKESGLYVVSQAAKTINTYGSFTLINDNSTNDDIEDNDYAFDFEEDDDFEFEDDDDDETLSSSVQSSTFQVSSDDFEDTEFYDDNDIRVEFCGIDFGVGYLTVKFWIDSDRDDDVTIYAKDIKINGEVRKTFVSLGDIESSSCDYFELTLEDDDDITVFLISEIELSLEFDDEDNEAMFETQKVHISCNIAHETFLFETVGVPPIVAYENDDDDNDEDFDLDFEEDDDAVSAYSGSNSPNSSISHQDYEDFLELEEAYNEFFEE